MTDLSQRPTLADLNLLISHFKYIPEEICISIDKDRIILHRKGCGTILCIINMATEKVEIYDRNWLRDIDIQLGQHITYATADFDLIFSQAFNKKLREDLRAYIRTDVVSTHK